MNREIKFRAWDKDYKKMINDIAIFPEYNWLVQSDNDPLCESDYKNVILMQYTGLKDKNGKEIFEGDIIKMTGYDPFNYVVDFHNGEFGLNWYGNDDKNFFIPIHYAETNGEVVSNIHENPELLKETTR